MNFIRTRLSGLSARKMKLIHLLKTMLAQLTFFALAASVSADDKSEKQNDTTEHGPLIPTDKKKQEEDPNYDLDDALIPAYVMATAILLVFIPWVLWRMIHNWGSWKLHTPYPRPQYIRTSFGWVEQETWHHKQAKRAKRKEAKRGQHKIYRTTKANYKWIYFDPTGELQERFNDQKERSYLRFLPSWMRSYPHGTLQSGVWTGQSKVPKDSYQLPELQFIGNSCRSLREALGNAQLDGFSMFGALPDPYQLPSLGDMEYRNAIMPSTPGTSCLPPQLPTMDGSFVVQVWHVRANPLPELTGHQRLESEEELRGEVESPEELARRDTEHTLAIGRDQVRTNHFGLEFTVELNTDRLPPLPRPPVQDPRPPVQDPPGQEPVSLTARHDAYIEGLDRRILDLEGRIQLVRTERTLLLIRGTLDNMMREIRGASRDRRLRDRPTPQNARQATMLQQYITSIRNLERRIHDIRLEPTESPDRGTLDNLMHGFLGARITLDRLPPVVPASRGQLHDDQINQLATPIANTDVSAEPGPRALVSVGMTVRRPDTRAVLDSVHVTDRLANDDFQTRLPNVWNPSDAPTAQPSATTTDAFNELFERLIARWVIASVPTTVAPQTHGETDRAVIEDPVIDNNTGQNPMSEEEISESNRVVTEGPYTDDNFSPNTASEDELQSDTRNPIAAALLRSISDYDAGLELVDAAAAAAVQSFLESEEGTRAEAVRQTAAFYTEMGNPDPALDVHVQGVRAGDDAASIGVDSPYQSTASVPDPSATATQATTVTAAAPFALDVEPAFDEELYSDAY